MKRGIFGIALLLASAFAPASTLDVGGPSAGASAGSYPVEQAAFGGALAPPTFGTLMTANATGCAPLDRNAALAANGNVLMLMTGGCDAVTKATNAQAAGAIALVIQNDAPGPAPYLTGVAPSVAIPVVSLDKDTGDLLRTALRFSSRTRSGVYAALSDAAPARMAAASLALRCDANGDGRIDLSDLAIIQASIGLTVAPGDPRDGNGDGRITINDVRACSLRCTSPNCAL